MYDTINLTELKRMADLAEAAPPELFCMAWVFDETGCGTAGCLVGTWVLNTPHDRLARGGAGLILDDKLIPGSVATAIRFGITIGVAKFLFFKHGYRSLRTYSGAAVSLTQSQAIARLRKYIRYVERKRALWQDESDLAAMSRRDRWARMMQPRQSTTVEEFRCSSLESETRRST